MGDSVPGFMSYKNARTVISDSVCQFLHGMLYGAAWGCVDPFPIPNASTVASRGPFRPLPIMGNLSSVPYSAVCFGVILGWQQLTCKSLELLRRREDYWNEVFGFAMVYPYYRIFLNHSERRLLLHNRAVGGGVILATLYGAFFA